MEGNITITCGSIGTHQVCLRIISGLSYDDYHFTSFWGATKQRYMAYLRWSFLTHPKLEGGLGLRDITLLNQALIMKGLWKLASGVNSLWVKVVTAKYMPRSSLWSSGRLYASTHYWRGMMLARQALAAHLQWVPSNGRTCAIFD